MKWQYKQVYEYPSLHIVVIHDYLLVTSTGLSSVDVSCLLLLHLSELSNWSDTSVRGGCIAGFTVIAVLGKLDVIFINNRFYR